MVATSTALITTVLRNHGGSEENVRLFGEDGPDLLAYATLANTRHSQSDELRALCGVYEWQQQPLAFLVDGYQISSDQHLQKIRRYLALRGDAPYLCVIKVGQLTVHRIGLDAAAIQSSVVLISPDVDKAMVLPHLSNVRPGLSTRQRWIGQVVLTLLDDAITCLINKYSVQSQDAISLVGRALFVRFLADRGLLSDAIVRLIGAMSTEHLFDDPKAALKINAWLNTTFNGDLLPLPNHVLDQLPSSAFFVLGNILRRAPSGQLTLEWEESWAHLDFAHIPVGVLSQAYEHYLRIHDPETQQKEGGYYTPAILAQMMLRGAMHAIRAESDAHRARILDPAAGAGVFLISAFRSLVAERWMYDGVRPSTKVLREILYEQIAGFDVNEEALRFAALGLYLMVIELDPNPHPIEALRFDLNLRERVLFKVGTHGSAGSLGKSVSSKHENHYDIVIGNPPWSSSTAMAEWDQVVENVEEVASHRLRGTQLKAVLPNEVMDLPFVWRAMQWCRPGGQIALALHGRLLFQQGDRMPEARNAIFNALDITGIVNGADLRNSRVWPDVGAPFCLLFARNERPTAASSFRFVSPRREDRLNAVGMFRLDATNAPLITPSQVFEQPEILKILYRGGPLDLELLDRMKVKESVSVDGYWRDRFGELSGKAKWSGNGYQRLRLSSRIRRNGDGLPGVAADYLFGLPHLAAMRHLPPLLDVDFLRKFDLPRLHDPRPRDLFRGPLLLVHQSPPAHSGRLNVAVCDGDVVFTESFYGYSAHKHPQGGLLVRFLALIIGSKPGLWHSLLTSGKFGFEREVVEKSVIDAMCVPMFESLDKTQLETVERLFKNLSSAKNLNAWQEIDAWVAKLYGFRESDVEVISDTLQFSAPFASSRTAAQLRPQPQQIKRFLTTLENCLNPLLLRNGRKVTAMEIPVQHEFPWRMLKLMSVECLAMVGSNDLGPILKLAEQLGTTEVIVAADNGGLVIAKLDHARYWTATQARLLGRRLVWEHMQNLLGAV